MAQEVERDDRKSVRFSQLQRIFPVIRALQGGQRLGVEEVGALSGFTEQQSRRVMHFLRDEMKLTEKREGHRVVVFERSRSTVRTTDMLGMVAIELANAAMAVFQGSEVHRAWQAIAARAADDAPNAARHLHDQLERGIFMVAGPHSDMRKIQPTLDEVIDALVHRNVIGFNYRGSGAVRARRVEPWTVAIHAGTLYLLGPECGEVKVKTWRLDKMEGCIRLRDTSFDYPNRFRHRPEAFFQDSFGIWKSESPVEEVRVRVHEPLKDYVTNTVWHPSEQKEDEGPSVLLSLRITESPELVRWLLSLAPHADILGPAGLADQIAGIHAAAAVRAPPREHPDGALPRPE